MSRPGVARGLRFYSSRRQHTGYWRDWSSDVCSSDLEEDVASFKQTEGCCYSARDLAVVRARQRGVPVVLGSATPALETYHNATSGRYQLIELPERINEIGRASCREGVSISVGAVSLK